MILKFMQLPFSPNPLPSVTVRIDLPVIEFLMPSKSLFFAPLLTPDQYFLLRSFPRKCHYIHLLLAHKMDDEIFTLREKN